MTVYLIRHAQTVHNKKGKVFSGRSDVSLSEEGKKQAEKCKNFPFIKDIGEVYITPLTRTAQTADIIFPKSIPRYTVPELSEMDFGDYEGRVLDESDENDEVFYKWINCPETLTFPGGNNFSLHALSAYNAFRKTALSSKENAVAIISHATTIRLIITQLLGQKLSSFRSIPCENCSAAKITIENGIFTVDEINITA